MSLIGLCPHVTNGFGSCLSKGFPFLVSSNVSNLPSSLSSTGIASSCEPNWDSHSCLHRSDSHASSWKIPRGSERYRNLHCLALRCRKDNQHAPGGQRHFAQASGAISAACSCRFVKWALLLRDGSSHSFCPRQHNQGTKVPMLTATSTVRPAFASDIPAHLQPFGESQFEMSRLMDRGIAVPGQSYTAVFCPYFLRFGPVCFRI